MKLSVILRSKIIDFLLSLQVMHSADSQRAFIYRAGLDTKLRAQILFGQSPAQFVPLLVSHLISYGKLEDGRNALESVLECTKNYVGHDRVMYCDALIREIHATPPERTQIVKRHDNIRHNPAVVSSNNRRSALIHLHPDFFHELKDVLMRWNQAQTDIEFIGLRPAHNLELALVEKGAISDDEASDIADLIRTHSGYSTDAGIIVFTEKRLYDEEFYQLFVGGREFDETPPNIGILSLHFLRQLYSKKSPKTLMFRAIVSNILFSIGIDAGLEDHDNIVKGCIMDFCYNMPDIQKGLRNGPKFCPQCMAYLEQHGKTYLIQLVNSFLQTADLDAKDGTITKTILFRDQAYKKGERFNYDIMLSFVEEDNVYAKQLVHPLRKAGIDVFCEAFSRAKLWGKERQIYLTDLYRLRAKYNVVLFSQSSQATWKNRELETLFSKIFEANEDYILPIRLDSSEMPTVLSTCGYLNWAEETVESITQLIQQKLCDYHETPTNYLL